MIRSAASRPRGAKSATGVLGLVLTRWRLASTDAGRNEALGLHRVGASSIASRYSLWVRGIPLPGNGRRRRVSCCLCLESHLALERPQCKQFKKKQTKKWAAAATRIEEKTVPYKVKTHKLESYHFMPALTATPSAEIVLPVFRHNDRERAKDQVRCTRRCWKCPVACRGSCARSTVAQFTHWTTGHLTTGRHWTTRSPGTPHQL